MMRLAFLLLILAAAPTAAQAQSGTCAHDKARLLAMDLSTFDQTPQGWRSVAQHDECITVAADLIAAYRRAFDGALKDDGMGTLLYWHEGQLRGACGTV